MVASYIVFFPALNSWLFWDDYIFFGTHLLSQAPHALVYWVDGPFFKTWPMGFTCAKVLYGFFGKTYWVYKFFALLVHVVNARLLFSILVRFLSWHRALLICLLFTIHPMQVETVLWIFQINNLLCTFFLLLAGMSFIHYETSPQKWLYYPLALLAFFFSVNSKALTLFFPLLVLFHLKYQRERWRRATLLTLPFLALSAYYGYQAYRGAFSYRGERSSQQQLVKKAPPAMAKTEVLLTVAKDALDKNDKNDKSNKSDPGEASKPMVSSTYRAINLGEKAQLFLQGMGFYFATALMPFPLMLIYPKLFWQWPLVALFFALLVAIYYRRKKNPALDYFFMVWLLSFIPSSGLAYVAYFKFSFVANRFMYLGLVGIIGLVVCFWKTSGRTLLWCSLPMVLGFACYSRYYADIFTHPTAVYEHNYRHHPSNIYPLILLSRQHWKLGKREQAVAVLERVIQSPDPLFFHDFSSLVQLIFYYQAERWVFLSSWYRGLGQMDDALFQLKQGLILHPQNPELHRRIRLIEGS